MKALTCEMCGGTNIVKQDGVYVCQSCGTKYSPEEAKKLLLEISMSSVDEYKGKEAENMVALARTAYESGNGREAHMYATRALESKPDNTDAWMIKMMSYLMIATYDDRKNQEVTAIGNKIIGLDKNLATDVYKVYLAKMYKDLKLYSELLEDTIDKARELYNKLRIQNITTASQEARAADFLCDKIFNQLDSICELRSEVPDFIVHSDPEIADWVLKIGRQWIAFTIALNTRFNAYNLVISDETILHYQDILTTIKSGLPADKAVSLNPSLINNTYNTSLPDEPEKSGCYVATAVYGSYDCPEVWTLRRFRDYTLAETWYGRAFISIYYAISPTIVKWFGKTEWFKRMWHVPLDKFVSRLQNRGVANTPYNDRRFDQ